jgi:hypothetical protein
VCHILPHFALTFFPLLCPWPAFPVETYATLLAVMDLEGTLGGLDIQPGSVDAAVLPGEFGRVYKTWVVRTRTTTCMNENAYDIRRLCGP